MTRRGIVKSDSLLFCESPVLRGGDYSQCILEPCIRISVMFKRAGEGGVSVSLGAFSSVSFSLHKRSPKELWFPQWVSLTSRWMTEACL